MSHSAILCRHERTKLSSNLSHFILLASTVDNEWRIVKIQELVCHPFAGYSRGTLQVSPWLAVASGSTTRPTIIKAVDVPCVRCISTARRCLTSVPFSILGLIFLGFCSTPEALQYPPVRKPHDLLLSVRSSCVRVCGHSYSAWHGIFLHCNPILPHNVNQRREHWTDSRSLA